MDYKRVAIMGMLLLMAATGFGQQVYGTGDSLDVTINVDTSANNYYYVVVVDTNAYLTPISVTIPGYTIDGSDTLTVSAGLEGTEVAFRLKSGTDFAYGVRQATSISGSRTLASANNLEARLGDVNIIVTGTTTIRSINKKGFTDGYDITLRFSASLTVDDGSGLGSGDYSDIELNGGVDFSATSNDILVLTYDLTNDKWLEKSRSVN